MRTRIMKHPDGVSIVIPDSLAAMAGLREGTLVELALAGASLVVRAAETTNLADLLAGITRENLHPEWAPARAGIESL